MGPNMTRYGKRLRFVVKNSKWTITPDKNALIFGYFQENLSTVYGRKNNFRIFDHIRLGSFDPNQNSQKMDRIRNQWIQKTVTTDYQSLPDHALQLTDCNSPARLAAKENKVNIENKRQERPLPTAPDPNLTNILCPESGSALATLIRIQ